MSEIVGKLLVLARSDAGTEPVSIQEVDVAGLLTELVQDVEALAQEKGLRLSFGPMDGLTVSGDRVRLQAAVPEHPGQRRSATRRPAARSRARSSGRTIRRS